MTDDQRLEELAKAMLPDSSPSPVPMPGIPVQIIEQIGEPEETPVKMGDDEICNIIDNHLNDSADWVGTSIALEQAKAMEYYLGLPVGDMAGPGIQDRSEVVDTVVRDVIEWLMPALMEIFFSSDPVKFSPRKQGDEAGADQMTATCNYVVRDQNQGFAVFQDWFRTALLMKVGIIKGWWEQKTEVTQETYTGLTDEQLAILVDDPEVTLTSDTSYIDPFAARAAMAQYSAAMQAFQQEQATPQLPPPAAPAQPPGQPPAPPPKPLAPPPPIDPAQLPRLHNVVLTVSRKSGQICIETVNSENFLISRGSRRLGDGFCAERIRKTVSEWKALGYDNLDDLQSDPAATTIESSAIPFAREALQDQFDVEWGGDDGHGDPSQREVIAWECYLPIDCDKDGIAEWRKITKSGSRVLANEVCDGPQYASLCPISIPGLFHGLSIADLAMPVQRLKTSILRAIDDNIHIQVNGRNLVDETRVNMSDYLDNRPGGGVRAKGFTAANPPVIPLNQGMSDLSGALSFSQYVDTMQQERTGVTKYSQGLDSDTLNHTAHGIDKITARADLRTLLIARTFAETGVKDLFFLIQKLLAKYQDKNMVFQVAGAWTDVSPRVWKNKYSMKAGVGTGTGDTTQLVAQLTQLLGLQQAIRANPDPMISSTVTAKNVFQTMLELVKAMKLGGDPSQFISPPTAPQPAPPQPNPQQMLVQGQLQIEQQKANDAKELQTLKIQTQSSADQTKAKNAAVLEQQHQQLIDARERDAQAQNLAWDREQFYASLAEKREAAALAAKVTDPSTEIALNRGIREDQQSSEESDIDREFELVSTLLQ